MESIDKLSARKRLKDHGIKPSLQRTEIMFFLMKNNIHPTVDDVYRALLPEIPSLSRTTVYNTLRLLAAHHAARMITIDDHRVCYDGNISQHVHFFCRRCGRVFDLMSEHAPAHKEQLVEGNLVDDVQLYYKGICKDCRAKEVNGDE